MRTRGRGSKNPKFLRTSYLEDPSCLTSHPTQRKGHQFQATPETLSKEIVKLEEWRKGGGGEPESVISKQKTGCRKLFQATTRNYRPSSDGITVLSTVLSLSFCYFSYAQTHLLRAGSAWTRWSHLHHTITKLPLLWSLWLKIFIGDCLEDIVHLHPWEISYISTLKLGIPQFHSCPLSFPFYNPLFSHSPPPQTSPPPKLLSLTSFLSSA